MTTAGHATADAARDTTDNKYFQLFGRVGLAAFGLVHFTIAYLAVVGSGTGAVLLAGALVALLIAV